VPEPFPIPEDFRAFMRTVSEHLDRPAEEKFLDTEDAFQHECGHGGRTFGGTTNYNFTYISPDGQHRWELALREQQIRDIADGTITEVDGERDDIVRTAKRTARGFPLCVWGEFRNDAFRIRSPHALLDVLDSLHRSAAEDPRMLRLWSAGDDQVVAVLWREDCALYVVESSEGYGTSEGDRSRTGGFEAADHDGQAITVEYADCIEWSVAKRALVRFSEHGDVGTEFTLSGSIPTGFLMHGDFDRAAVIAARGEPPQELQMTSLLAMVQTTTTFDVNADWAARVLDFLDGHGFIKVDAKHRDGILETFSGWLSKYGEEADEKLDTADWLANELGRLKGISNAIVSGGDLQLALQRGR
jgi:hypothetical protein